jgi:hypothetical protein
MRRRGKLTLPRRRNETDRFRDKSLVQAPFDQWNPRATPHFLQVAFDAKYQILHHR